MKTSFFITAPLHIQQYLYSAPICKGRLIDDETFVPSSHKQVSIFTDVFDLGLGNDYIDFNLVKRLATQEHLILQSVLSNSVCLKGRFANESVYCGYPLFAKKEKPISAIRLLSALGKISLDKNFLRESHIFRQTAYKNLLGVLVHSHEKKTSKGFLESTQIVSFNMKLMKKYPSSKWKIYTNLGKFPIYRRYKKKN
jgi:hypothetical protein